MWTVIYAIIMLLVTVLVWTDIISGIMRRPGNLANEVYLEIRPFIWAAWLIIGIDDFINPTSQLSGVFGAVAIILAWIEYKRWKNNDDDRWKKRRKRAAEKIAEVGGKLVVQPIPAGA